MASMVPPGEVTVTAFPLEVQARFEHEMVEHGGMYCDYCPTKHPLGELRLAVDVASPPQYLVYCRKHNLVIDIFHASPA